MSGRDYFRNALRHLKTINRHKAEVMKGCFRIGLYRQGLLHDLSKYGWSEFKTGVKYYSGHRSPNTIERLQTGISPAWLHHKGRNKHHFEYWCDYDLSHKGQLVGCRMPYRYIAEMFCDRVAASKVYQGKAYHNGCAWEYFLPTRGSELLHPETREELTKLLLLLRDEGEEKAFSYLKEEVKRRKKARDNF